jgi:hypothetical protein
MSSDGYSFDRDESEGEGDHFGRTVAELGEPEALFRVSGGRFQTKLVVGSVLLVCGLATNYWWWVFGPARPDHFALSVLIGLPVVGFGLLMHMYGNRGLMILVYPTGLLRLRRGEIDSFPWQKIPDVRLKVQTVAAPSILRDDDGELVACWLPAEVPAFQLWKSGLTLAREDGVETQFGPALSDFPGLAEEIQKRTFAELWPDVWERFQAGKVIAFGDLEVSRKGFRHANGKKLPWREFKEIGVAAGQLRIKQEGNWFPAIIMDVYSVSNPHILFALVHEACSPA